MQSSTSAQYSFTLRLEIQNIPGMLGKVTTAIGDLGGNIDAIDIVNAGRDIVTRDITIQSRNEEHGKEIIEGMKKVQRGRRPQCVGFSLFNAFRAGRFGFRTKFP